MAEKKVALVSGAATGIGRDSAVRLAQDGFQLVLCDWNRAEGEKTLAMCREANPAVECDFLEIDMGIEAKVMEFIDFAVKKHGKIDFYLNNQGVIHMPKDFDDITEEDFDYVVHSNFKACFFGMKHCIKQMKKQNYGNICNVASSSGIRPETGFGVYSATKHAAIGLTKDAAIEYGRNNIRVNAICPGGVITPLTQAVGKHFMDTGYQQPRPVPIGLNGGNLATTDQITGIVSFMASDASSYMTGSIISADGGITQ